MRRHVGAGCPASAAQSQSLRPVGFAPPADPHRGRGEMAHLHAGERSGRRRADAGARRAAPESSSGRGALGAMREPGDGRTALDKESIKNSFLDDLFYMQGKFAALATQNDYYLALAYAVRDRMLQRWNSTAAEYTRHGSRTVAYLSAEFLTGPHLGNNLLNLNIIEPVRECLG